jgi:hypothetical protein
MYPGADTRDAAPDFQAAYPAASFGKILARAFVASRTLDFVLSPAATGAVSGLHLPSVDVDRVSITGHSRNGKQSVIAAAFDERFTSVVGSSPGELSACVRCPKRLDTTLLARCLCTCVLQCRDGTRSFTHSFTHSLTTITTTHSNHHQSPPPHSQPTSTLPSPCSLFSCHSKGLPYLHPSGSHHPTSTERPSTL